MSNIVDFVIKRINKENYNKYNDMVAWRINGVERTEEEKKRSKNTIFEDVYNELEHEGFYVYAAEVEGRYIGWISLMYIPKIGKWHKGTLFVDELWTAPEFRKNGVAYGLMNKALELQRELGAMALRLYTNNMPARKLYEKCGLVVEGEAVFMEKR